MNRYPEFDCLDCEINTREIDEYYMVQNEIWDELVPEREGMLCIGCLEQRLGRELNYTDFTCCPLNIEQYDKSERLKDRINKLV